MLGFQVRLRKNVWLLVAVGFLPISAFCASPVAPIVVSITPLQWLVEAIAPKGAHVQTIMPAGKSPHDYLLLPSDLALIKNSALLVWVGPAMETWLVQRATSLSPDRQLALLPASADKQHNAETSTIRQVLTDDPHIWLDPLRLAEVAVPLAARLTQLYPKDKALIAQRLADYQRTMAALSASLMEGFAPVAKRSFVVYHDGYAPLVRRYGLNQRMAVWRHEAIANGVREREALIKLLRSGEVTCLFYEPEYGASAVNGWLGKAADNVSIVELDPLGQDVPPGPNDYLRFMRALSEKMVACLQGKKVGGN